MRRFFALVLSMLLIVLVAPLANAAVEATYSGGGRSGTSVTMNRGSGNQSLGTRLFDLKVTGEGTLPAYCIDIQHEHPPDHLRRGGLGRHRRSRRRKILWILKNSYPTKSVGEVAAAVGTAATGLTTEEAIGATQAAIWTFSDGATYVPFATRMAARRGSTHWSPTWSVRTTRACTTPPAPSLSLTPGECRQVRSAPGSGHSP